jgi:subtilisin family serine protease
VVEFDFQISGKSANATLSERDLFGLNKRNTPTAEPGPSTSQSPSEVYLRVVSWGPNIPDLKKLSNYKYQTTASQGIAVYVIDTGVNVQHKEYTGLAVTAQAPIDAQDKGGPQYKAGTADAKGHGSCAFSKVVSPTYGVAKKVTIVAVKAQSTFEDTVKAFEVVLVDFLARNGKGRAVVNLSRGVVGTSMTQQQGRLLRKRSRISSSPMW